MNSMVTCPEMECCQHAYMKSLAEISLVAGNHDEARLSLQAGGEINNVSKASADAQHATRRWK